MHQTSIRAHDGQWRAVCSCDQGSLYSDHKWEADDWAREHIASIDRVRLLGASSPSLRDQYRWFRSREKDPRTPQQERNMWKQLADELEHRMGPSESHDQALF